MAQELDFSTIWSWGWTSYVGQDDPDFPKAACVWLWTRASSLCNGPGAAGAGWNSSTTEGQYTFPTATQCTRRRRGSSTESSISQLEELTGDRDIAYSALFARAVEASVISVTQSEVLAAERTLIWSRFGGSRPAYQAALVRANVTRAMARAIIADQLRRAKVAERRHVPKPSAAHVETFYESYPDLLVREVKAKPAPSWLGWKARGFALEAVAPEGIFGLTATSARTLQTLDGEYKVRAVGSARPLGSMPLSVVTPAIRVALTAFAQGDAFEQWTTKVQTAALATTICRGDELPAPAPVELETLVPAVSLGCRAARLVLVAEELSLAGLLGAVELLVRAFEEGRRVVALDELGDAARQRQARNAADRTPRTPLPRRARRAAQPGGVPASGRMIANSSPPTRHAMSDARRTARTRSAVSARTPSPAR